MVVQDYVGSFKDGNTRLGSVAEEPVAELPPLQSISEETMQDPKYNTRLAQMRSKVEKFTKEWNDNPDNRDKTINVIKELTLTKEEFQDSIRAMVERDGKIDEI